MPLPLILIASASTVGRFIATKGLQKAIKKYGPKLITKGKKYIKDNKLIVRGKNTVETGKGKVTKVTNASKAKGGGTKINTTPKKKITATNTKPNKNTTTTKNKNTKTTKTNKNTTTTKTNKNTGPSKAKGGGKFTKRDKALGAVVVGAAIAPLIKGPKFKAKKPEAGKPTITDKQKRSSQGVGMDDMLDKKQEKAINNMDRQKRESQSIGGGFGAGVNFSSKDVSKLRENARKLTSQINSLDITSMQKKRLKDELNTRKKNFGMGESYQKSFNIIKDRVKNKKLNIPTKTKS